MPAVRPGSCRRRRCSDFRAHVPQRRRTRQDRQREDRGRVGAGGGAMTATVDRARNDTRQGPLDVVDHPMVVVHDVRKSYGQHEVLHGIDLTIDHGEVAVVLGASGSGKSTLLRCINQLEKVNSGYIAIDGDIIGFRRSGNTLLRAARTRRAPPARARRHGLPELQPVPAPHRASRTSPRRHGRRSDRSRREAEELARDFLARVGLADRADDYPAVCRADNSSASPSPGPSPWNPR